MEEQLGNVINAAAVGFLLSCSSATSAPLTIRGHVVPEDQVNRLQAHCNAQFEKRSVSGNGRPKVEDETNTVTFGTSSAQGAEKPLEETSGPVDFAKVDLATITAGDCEKGGFRETPTHDGSSAEPLNQPG
jgi:hypothetical protein